MIICICDDVRQPPEVFDKSPLTVELSTVGAQPISLKLLKSLECCPARFFEMTADPEFHKAQADFAVLPLDIFPFLQT